MRTTKSLKSVNFQLVNLPNTSYSEGGREAVEYMSLTALIHLPKSPWQFMQLALDEFEPNFKISRYSQYQQNRNSLL